MRSSISSKMQVCDDVVDGSHQCHLLPCNIDFNGRADVDVYFTTQVVSGGAEGSRVLGSQLRGRQLLASEPYQHSGKTEESIIPMQGRLLEIDTCKAKTDEGKVRVVEKFTSICEWKHECEPLAMKNPTYENSRVLASFQWQDVAHAVR